MGGFNVNKINLLRNTNHKKICTIVETSNYEKIIALLCDNNASHHSIIKGPSNHM